MGTTRATETGADRELHVRMLVALALLLLIPFALVYSLLFIVNAIVPIALGFLTGEVRPIDVWIEPQHLLVAAVLGFVAMYFIAPRFVVSSLEGRRPWVDDPPATESVEALTTKLASQIDIPPPDVIVLESEMPNALSIGTPRTGRIAVTTALVDVLEPDELEAVLAHEMAHLANRDATIMTIAWIVPAITYTLTVVAAGVIIWLGGSGSSRSSRNRRRADSHASGGRSARSEAGSGRSTSVPPGISPTIAIAMTAIATLAVSVVFWAASGGLYRLLAQYREFTADRGAAIITGSPAALASALRKLDEEIVDVPDEDLRRFDGGAEALYVAPLDPSVFEEDSVVSSTIFPPTHPPTEVRIERLRELAGAQS